MVIFFICFATFRARSLHPLARYPNRCCTAYEGRAVSTWQASDHLAAIKVQLFFHRETTTPLYSYSYTSLELHGLVSRLQFV